MQKHFYVISKNHNVSNSENIFIQEKNATDVNHVSQSCSTVIMFAVFTLKLKQRGLSIENFVQKVLMDSKQ